MLVHNLVVTGSLTFPTTLPLSGSLLISGSLGIGTPTPDPGAVVTINKTGAGLQDVMYLTNTQAAAADTGANLWWLGTTSLNSLGRIAMGWAGAATTTSYMSFYTRGGGSTTEKMRISSSGSVGIGTTVLGWDDAQITALQIRNSSMYGYATVELGLVQNATYQGGWKYISTGAASYQVSSGGVHAFYTAPSGVASASVTWTERFAISNAGSASFNNGSSLASAADAATITIKQPSTVATNGIYLERSGEQKGYYIYISSISDSLTFRRNNAGTKADVMFLTRDGNVTINRPASGATLLQLNGSDAYGDTSTLNLCDGRSFVKSTILVSANGDTDISFGTQNGGVIAEKMYLNSAGRLSIQGQNNTWIDYSSNVARFYGGSGTNTFGLGAGSTIYYQGDNSQFYPTADNTRSIGLASNRYTAIWAVNGTIQTSDEREKTDIVDSDLGLNFVTKLRPISYKWKVGQNIETTETTTDEQGNETTKSILTPRAGIRTHYGLIAQEVEALLDGKDFGGFIHDKDSDVMGLRYEQFIPLLIKAIQEQQTTIEALTTRITALEN
jgi:hypothetical protein